MADGGLLFRDQADRERALDMSARLRPVQALAAATLAVPVLIAVPTYGALMVLPLLAAAVVYVLAKVAQDRVARPEWALAGAWVFGQIMITAAIALADGPRYYLFALPVVPTLFAAVIWSRRGVVLGTLMTMGLLAAVGLLFAHDEIAAAPPRLVHPLLLLVMTGLIGIATRDVDMVSRGTAVVDELTGALNRIALQARLTELAAQARSTAQQVGMVVVDVDRFKSINDVHGHATGDAVLREVAGRLADALGADGPLYRFGGEEFVAVLPGAGSADAVAVAERLRTRVGETPVAGLIVTVSAGVAVSAPGAGFDREETFERADAALYTAKERGRDRVCCAPPPATVPLAGRRASAPAAPSRATDAPAASVRPDAHAAATAGAGADRAGGNWLIKNGLEREQMLAVAERAGAASSRIVSGLLVAALIFGIPWYGWHPLVPLIVAAAPLDPVLRNARRFRHPEFVALGVLSATVFVSGLTVAAAEPQALFALPFMIVVIFGACAAFPPIGSWILFLLTAATMIAAAFVVDGSAVLDNPTMLALPLALAACSSLIGAGVGRSAVEHRSAAIVDQLTGVLNRAALEARLPELTHQAQRLHEPVSVLVGDLDHFKAINDEHGHARGDQVLTEVANRIRGELRAFDAVYRIGGEEFVVLLRGTTAGAAAEIAERIRAAVERTPVRELPVTISLGVAASTSDVAFDYGSTFGRADAALMAAKQAGRNRVLTAPAELATVAA